MAIDKALIDQLLADYKKPEEIIGENGLLKQLLRTEFRLGPGIGCGTDARGQFLDGISS